MAVIECPCGARVETRRTNNGWHTEYGRSYKSCTELKEAIKKSARIDMSDFQCKMLEQIVADKMRRSSAG